MYTFIALVQVAFKDKVRMLYIDTDPAVLQFFVENLLHQIKSLPAVWDAFD